MFAHVRILYVRCRSSPFSGFDDAHRTGEKDIVVIHSPKSGVNFLSLGDFETHMETSVNRARPLLLAGIRNATGKSMVSPA